MTLASINTRNKLAILMTLLIILLAGSLVGIDIKNSLYLAGLAGVLVYIFLCIEQPFAAFGILAALGLTVWLSGIKLIEGFSALVGLGLVFTSIWISSLLLGKTRFLWRPEFWPVPGFLVALAISAIIN